MAGELERRHEILVPLTGELIPADDPAAVAGALEHVRELAAQLRDAELALAEAVVGIASERGLGKTIHLEGGGTVVIRGGAETVYDVEAIEQALRRAKMPEQRISEIVVETVVVKKQVKAVELKKAASVNPKFKRIMERHSTTRETRPTVTVTLPPTSRAELPAEPKEGADH